MGKLLEFPQPNQGPLAPDYTGHLMMLDLSKARKFQSINFWLGVRCQVALVPENTSMPHLRQAVEQGLLIDITEHPELFVPDKPIAPVEEQDTGKRLYCQTRRFFRDLNIPDEDPSAPEGETVSYTTADAEEQRRIDEALGRLPVVEAAPLTPEAARRRARRPLIELAPGMDHPELYLLGK